METGTGGNAPCTAVTQRQHRTAARHDTKVSAGAPVAVALFGCPSRRPAASPGPVIWQQRAPDGRERMAEQTGDLVIDRSGPGAAKNSTWVFLRAAGREPPVAPFRRAPALAREGSAVQQASATSTMFRFGSLSSPRLCSTLGSTSGRQRVATWRAIYVEGSHTPMMIPLELSPARIASTVSSGIATRFLRSMRRSVSLRWSSARMAS